MGYRGEADGKDKLLLKLSALIEQSEKLLFDACAKQPHEFVFSEPLWLSWTLENFSESLYFIAGWAVMSQG